MQVHSQVLQVRVCSIDANHKRIIARKALLFQPQPELGVAFKIVQGGVEELLELREGEIGGVHDFRFAARAAVLAADLAWFCRMRRRSLLASSCDSHRTGI
jgi:hypothetical protein